MINSQGKIVSAVPIPVKLGSTMLEKLTAPCPAPVSFAQSFGRFGVAQND